MGGSAGGIELAKLTPKEGAQYDFSRSIPFRVGSVWLFEVPMLELSVSEWVKSDYLRRVATRVGFAYHLPTQDVPDLYQELCLALWKAGEDRRVNATWVFHTANHQAARLAWRNRRATAISTGNLVADPKDPELELLVRAQVRRLPASLRTFYQLRYEEGLSQREVLRRQNLTRGSVRGLERQCLRWIRRVAV
jgi:DNA-directed RNA polymerase specialized sigma24 family protein